MKRDLKKYFLIVLTFFCFFTSAVVKAETNNSMTTDEIKNLLDDSSLSCGGISFFSFPAIVPNITSILYNLLKVAIPIILVIKGMMDMFKAMSSQKEDEMKKSQKKFVQRLIAGGCALLVFIIVETVINFIADKTNDSGAMACVNCFIKGSSNCETVIYSDDGSNNGDGSSTTNKFTCLSGYNLYENKICIMIKDHGVSNSTMSSAICDSGWTLTATLTGDCIKVRSAKNNGKNVLSDSNVKCDGGTCKAGGVSFSIGKPFNNKCDGGTQISGKDYDEKSKSSFCIYKK